MLTNKQLTIRFAMLQGFYFMIYSFLGGYFVVFLTDAGVSASMMGVLQAIVCLAAVVVQLILGYLCDKYGISRSVFILCAIATPITLYMLANSKNIYVLLAASLIYGGFLASIQSVCGGWIANLNHHGANINFGLTRGTGSMSYAIFILVLGCIYERVGGWIFPYIAGVIGIFIIIASLRLPPITVNKYEEKVAIKEAIHILTKNKAYVAFAIAYVTFFIPFSAFNTYFSVVFQSLGGTVSSLGFAWFVMSIFELPMMMYYKKIEDKFGVDKLFILAAFGFMCKTLLVVLSPNIYFATFVTLLQVVSFAIAIPCSQSYVENLIPAKYSMTAQLVVAVAGTGVGQIVGNFLVGFLAGLWGVNVALICTSFFPMLGLAIFYGFKWIDRSKVEEK